MNIVMLGHSGAGKTTFMAAMYACLHKPVHGFRLVAKESTTHRHLLDLAHSIKQGRYPNPTDARSSYDFWLYRNGKRLLDLTCLDYRGGALEETASSSALQTLIDDLARADGILVLLEASKVTSGSFSNPEIGRMMVLLGRAIQHHGYSRDLSHHRGITVALAKWDLLQATPCPRRSLWQRFLDWFRDRPFVLDDSEIIKNARSNEHVTECLRGLHAAAKAHGRINTSVMPVSFRDRSIVNVHLAALHTLASSIAYVDEQRLHNEGKYVPVAQRRQKPARRREQPAPPTIRRVR